jgi:hypothetical protein
VCWAAPLKEPGYRALSCVSTGLKYRTKRRNEKQDKSRRCHGASSSQSRCTPSGTYWIHLSCSRDHYSTRQNLYMIALSTMSSHQTHPRWHCMCDQSSLVSSCRPGPPELFQGLSSRLSCWQCVLVTSPEVRRPSQYSGKGHLQPSACCSGGLSSV